MSQSHRSPEAPGTLGTGVRVWSTIGFQILPVQAALSLHVDGEAELR